MSITDIQGIRVGHYTDTEHATGCTVILCEGGAMGGVDVRGSSPGTREIDLLRPTFQNEAVHAIVLSGGSLFGLDSASGVVKYLEENKIGLSYGDATLPVVPAAILFDLNLITNKVRPGPEEGYKACENATDTHIDEGSVGAGTGATVAKALGGNRGVKGGIGTASIDLGDGVKVGAIVAVNAVGGVYEPNGGHVIAGPLNDDRTAMQDSMKLMLSPNYDDPRRHTSTNTTIGVVATNVALNKERVNKLASVAHDGLAIAIRPAHLMTDGDTMFALSTRILDVEVSMNKLLAATSYCVSEAIVRAVKLAKGLGDVPAVSEL